MLAINQILQKRYRIIRQLGHGGMGAVYEAIDERFGEPIALKEIVVDFTNESHKDSIIKAFEREAKSLAKAKHEAVPYVRDYFSELDRQFLVMELIEGDDLAEMLQKRNTPFPLKDVLIWMEQLLDALDYLHTLKPPIIHRDIKPQNLKLNTRGKIKLLDFGIARSGDKNSTLTNHTFVAATLNYSPIEQILRVIDPTFREFILLKHQQKAEQVLNQATDTRCDIYALGGTFYHLLTNRIPTDATKRTLEIWEGNVDSLPNPSELNPTIPKSVSNILLKAMAIERDNRFSSAIEMQKALEQAISEEKRHERDARRLVEQSEQLKREQAKQLQLQKEAQEKVWQNTAIQSKTEELTSASETISNKVVAQPDHSTATTQRLEISYPEKESSKIISTPSITEPSLVQLLNTQPSEIVSNTQSSGNISESNLLEPSFSEVMLADNKTSSVLPSTIDKQTKSKIFPMMEKDYQANSNKLAKSFWGLPIALIGLLTISGIGVFIWLKLPPQNNSISNTNVARPNSNQTTIDTNKLTLLESNKPVATPKPDKTSIKDAGQSTTTVIRTPRPPTPTPTINRTSGTKNKGGKQPTNNDKQNQGCIFLPEGCK